MKLSGLFIFVKHSIILDQMIFSQGNLTVILYLVEFYVNLLLHFLISDACTCVLEPKKDVLEQETFFLILLTMSSKIKKFRNEIRLKVGITLDSYIKSKRPL